MILFPNAKINLGLSVTERRPDGFHNIETVMIPLPLCDVLEVVPSQSGSTTFNLTGIGIEGDPRSNLVMKAWNIMQQKFNLRPVAIHLHKAIPAGAGLGGGSSDAAAMVRICNQLFTLNLSEAEMELLVKPIGSDCAFFIRNRTALATGKGDQLIPLSRAFQNYTIALVKPDIHIPTAEAYGWVMPEQKNKPLTDIVYSDHANWPQNLINDFEKPVFSRYPGLKKIRDVFYQQGAVYASLTGTGAAVYGLFTNPIDIESLFPDDFVWQGRL